MSPAQAMLLKIGELVEITAQEAKQFDMDADIGEIIKNTHEGVIIRWSDGFEGNFPHNMMQHISKG
jgi:hypothetical protein